MPIDSLGSRGTATIVDRTMSEEFFTSSLGEVETSKY